MRDKQYCVYIEKRATGLAIKLTEMGRTHKALCFGVIDAPTKRKAIAELERLALSYKWSSPKLIR